MKKLYGTVVPIITPFTGEDRIDVESLNNLTEYVIEGGLQCLYPCGTTGEMLLLTPDERMLVLETVIKKTAGRIPVFAQAGAMTLKDTIELARHAVKAGADGIGVVTPSYFKLSDDGLVDYYTAVAGSVPEDFPVYLYAIPQNAVNDINLSTAERIAAACKNVVGIKYSFPDMTRIQEFMTINRGEFSVLVGPDHLYHAVCAVGGDGTVSGNAMILREHYAALWNAISSGDNKLSAKIQRRTNVLNHILCRKNNISAYKSLLCREGIIRSARMRAPMESLSDGEVEMMALELKTNRYREVIL
ncbi:dihydrodipicolinate synthase family protein [[Clostridium] symbiosum]|uniref:dihydrodipicolinate synthase family protein n=1 Tax=Clostridium symbiosum TaxID=1512 RepID=UPI001D0737DE|nr:dihydrodipicolinate synthase family protein [[Clostridium] symbiosum]MCB6609492.1 dihydrodipicolinate synthase family protein [[Clostridium] symbiosum]MCB6929515.1 dihydrodipicolinate synthase family protein [[Clostridium] symbiosum]